MDDQVVLTSSCLLVKKSPEKCICLFQGCPTNSGCSGDTIHVDGSGNAHISISDGANPFAAIHVGQYKKYASILNCCCVRLV